MSFQYLTMREGFKDPVFHSSPKPMTHLEVLRARAEADEMSREPPYLGTLYLVEEVDGIAKATSYPFRGKCMP